MDAEYPTRQQYGPRPELLPVELNAINPYDITNLPHDVKALLLRDMGFGDKLITEEIARAYSKGLEELAMRFDRDNVRKFQGLPHLLKVKNLVLYQTTK